MAAGGGESSRATATVLFTDLVGSTELRSRLGEQAAEALRRQHDRLLTGAVEGHNGRLVKGLGDGIMATFAGASDAVAAAVRVQQAIDRHNRSPSALSPLTVRIGLSAGDVTFEAGDCFGTPVIEAARLCSAAQGGQILASEMVRWLVRGSGHGFSPLSALDLKGLPEPVPACVVAWEPVAAQAHPLPALLTDMGRVFVGRESEMARLQQACDEDRCRILNASVHRGRFAGVGAGRWRGLLPVRSPHRPRGQRLRPLLRGLQLPDGCGHVAEPLAPCWNTFAASGPASPKKKTRPPWLPGGAGRPGRRSGRPRPNPRGRHHPLGEQRPLRQVGPADDVDEQPIR